MDRLLPCPFCGCEAMVISKKLPEDIVLDVNCSNPSCVMRASPYEQISVARWNERLPAANVTVGGGKTSLGAAVTSRDAKRGNTREVIGKHCPCCAFNFAGPRWGEPICAGLPNEECIRCADLEDQLGKCEKELRASEGKWVAK